MQYGLVHISVGDLLREQVAEGTPAGKKAKGFMDTGNLVPDDVVVDMVVDRLGQADVQRAGWLLDGYPRSASQAEAIEKRDIRPDVFLLVNVPDEVIVERVVGRRTDPETGDIYHLTFSPPPAEIEDRLVQARPSRHPPGDRSVERCLLVACQDASASASAACRGRTTRRRRRTTASRCTTRTWAAS